MNINELQEGIISRFTALEDRMEKYGYIINMGKMLPPMDVNLRTDENLLWSCQAQVWVSTEERDGKLFITADSDASITKGLVGMLVHILSGQPMQDIAESDLYFIAAIDLKDHLTPNKSNGILSMIQGIKSLARREGMLSGTCVI
ncbi:cysteine desulfuration protein SufE [Pedobacter cryoconitis]|uniref:SufE family protein n=1 Tax=Pedobacter cryoconitis TaxID=188932 RepID=UPI001619755B|nr:SufE family protein [Pedobacter cryoconitis]MBB6270622.1 cysteine desulfuration protein SufE [Pedobacter cryoconitis]